MPSFSPRSKARLESCTPVLQNLFEYVIEHWDCTILEGYRDKERQNELYRTGKSHLQWPNSSHNTNPSEAIDVAPYPIDWNDRERFTYFAGFVKGVAMSRFGIKLRWGGDWDSDNRVGDNQFDDLPHFELVD